MVLCCDSFDASFELQPWQNGIQLLSIKSGSFCYCPQCGLHTIHSSPCDRCVCVCVWLQLSYQFSVRWPLNQIAWESWKCQKHLNTSHSFATHANQKQLIFLYSNEFFNFEFLSMCPFVCVFMKRWATHFNLSISLWINRFQLWWLISNTLWMSCELKIRTCAWMLK